MTTSVGSLILRMSHHMTWQGRTIETLKTLTTVLPPPQTVQGLKGYGNNANKHISKTYKGKRYTSQMQTQEAIFYKTPPT